MGSHSLDGQCFAFRVHHTHQSTGASAQFFINCVLRSWSLQSHCKPSFERLDRPDSCNEDEPCFQCRKPQKQLQFVMKIQFFLLQFPVLHNRDTWLCLTFDGFYPQFARLLLFFLCVSHSEVVTSLRTFGKIFIPSRAFINWMKWLSSRSSTLASDGDSDLCFTSGATTFLSVCNYTSP